MTLDELRERVRAAASPALLNWLRWLPSDQEEAGTRVLENEYVALREELIENCDQLDARTLLAVLMAVMAIALTRMKSGKLPVDEPVHIAADEILDEVLRFALQQEVYDAFDQALAVLGESGQRTGPHYWAGMAVTAGSRADLEAKLPVAAERFSALVSGQPVLAIVCAAHAAASAVAALLIALDRSDVEDAYFGLCPCVSRKTGEA